MRYLLLAGLRLPLGTRLGAPGRPARLHPPRGRRLPRPGAAREVIWQFLWDKTDDDVELSDRFSVCPQPDTLPEGFRRWWFHSTRKAALDLDDRGNRLRRAEQHLRDFQTCST